MEKICEDFSLKPLHKIVVIDSSDVEPSMRCDFIVDEIIKRMLPPGAIFSHAQNFEKGFYGQKDIQEAKKLYAISFKIAKYQESMGNTAGFGVLGYCYEHGYGTEQNLNYAIEYYREAAKTVHRYQDDYERVYQQLYGGEDVSKNEFGGIWDFIKKLWKK